MAALQPQRGVSATMWPKHPSISQASGPGLYHDGSMARQVLTGGESLTSNKLLIRCDWADPVVGPA